MQAAMSAALAPTATPALAGTRERGSSAWLGQASPPSSVFDQYRDIDRLLVSSIGRLTGGLSPTTLTAAFMDWWIHLLASPAKQLELAHLAANAALPWQAAGGNGQREIEPLPQDKRFADPRWHRLPFSAIAQAFLSTQHWWQRATTNVPGVTPHHEAMVAFGARQWLDMASPSNWPWSNPQVLERTLAEGGANLVRGARHAFEDACREAAALPPADAERFVVGRDLAATPGRVVARTRLAEVIQYTATTRRTFREPVLIVPAWIMKYYVLDLSPHNSLVKALVDQGFTVFMISWKNPTRDDSKIGLSDYVHLGIDAALAKIAQLLPGRSVHALGYCLGGTLLAMAAARLARTHPQLLKTITLLAAQTDFTDPGELGLFIDAGQVELLDDLMWRQGVLEARQMKGTFQLMRSQDLIWSYRVLNYLLGERRPLTDLMAWNVDGTRMPYRMHSEYLHTLFLDNALARGQAQLDGQPINLADLRAPIFNVGAVQDHIAPWRSVFKLHALTHAEQTFVLTAGGHNVGIVNPPGQARTSHRLKVWRPGDRLLTPDEWLDAAPQVEGSWWTVWFDWLREHSSGQHPAPQDKGHALGPAPGRYVLQH
jgi:polyhydroxyalkanoate synthase